VSQLYYVGLFLPRERDDERMCKAKYGDVWTEYVKAVPYRIVPGVY
jgi:protein-S-isoprenylcysteine O-methyltransferase Ste14